MKTATTKKQATVVAMAGDEVQMSPVAMMMIHNPAMIAKADVSVIVSGAVDIQMVKHLIIGTILLKRLYQLWRHEVILQSNLPILFS